MTNDRSAAPAGPDFPPEDDEFFTEVPWNHACEVFLEGLIRVRHDLRVDPTMTQPWSCDPKRCRPLLGRNLCCKVEVRCRHFRGDRCGIHDHKPFGCALFPLDLVRVRGVRVVTTVANPAFYQLGWCRYDRDMLRCFEGVSRNASSMFDAQRPELERVFTRAEMALMEARLTAAVPEGTGFP